MTNRHDIRFPHDLESPRGATSAAGIERDVPPGSPLDQERVASMADEGGVSGALMEIEDPKERKRLMQTQRRLGPGGLRKAAAAFALFGLAALAWGWMRRAA